jgi:hypothetical protein
MQRQKYGSLLLSSHCQLTPTKIKNPASHPEAGYLLLNTFHALPFWLKVEANVKRADSIAGKSILSSILDN